MDEIVLAIIAIDEPIALHLNETGHHSFNNATSDILLRQNQHPFKSISGEFYCHAPLRALAVN